MKILLFTDNHFCSMSSIVRQRGEKYTTRLENQIETLNWIENTAVENNCRCVVCLGDFFDKSNLSDEELTALKDVNWTDIDHYFIVGNHESSINGLEFNSTKALESTHRHIISEHYTSIVCGKTQIHLLPYVIETDRAELKTYLSYDADCSKHIILSHNDIKGIQMGPVVSRTGFEIDDITNSCDLYINGHLHNGSQITNKIINLGNVTGLNFSEDASKYSHRVMILDTDTLEYEYIENPYAINFYKFEFSHVGEDISVLSSIKNNSVLSIKCVEDKVDEVKKFIADNQLESKILDKRIVSIASEKSVTSDIENDVDLTIDYLQKFRDFCYDKIGHTETVNFELGEICK